MVNISRETNDEIDSRLRKVIQTCDLVIYDAAYHFDEFPLDEFSKRADQSALALVRDDDRWSQLVPVDPETADEPFALWRFHFPNGVDNSGFVGWVALELKHAFGTGVFVVCGQHMAKGGIYDYWGCPWAIRKQVHDYIRALVTPGKA